MPTSKQVELDSEAHAAGAHCRRLVLVLGDQLWLGNPALEGFDPAQDRVLMIEAASEAEAVWSHQARIALFLSAMRHFKEELAHEGWPCDYLALGTPGLPDTFAERLAHMLAALAPEELAVCEPGEWRVLALVQDTAAAAGVPLRVLADTHFICSREDFARWAGASKQLRMENFYRHMRRTHGVLMDNGQPAGDRWNFDADNRRGYPRQGPGLIPPPLRFEPDEVTRDVLREVAARFGHHPGKLDSFAWPVTRTQALHALHDFIEARLVEFGPFQDAMWTGTPWGWHALLSTSMNLRLLDPREVIAKAERAWKEGALPLASVEGFIRQVLGWREFIRGVYWLDMPQLGQANHFGHDRPLPAWYWTGQTRMNCLREVVGQTLEHGYAHHIQRLMVTGLFALLAGLRPQEVCDWYLAVYVDAVEWVELPNTAGMALYADGGRFTSKPYLASGQYIRKMSNYCDGCAYRPDRRTGDDACPFTTLFWHFLDTHQRELARTPRMLPMLRNLERIPDAERVAIARRAADVLSRLEAL
jgi:deoxyribodipyrimidine photolyase-related protein